MEISDRIKKSWIISCENGTRIFPIEYVDNASCILARRTEMKEKIFLWHVAIMRMIFQRNDHASDILPMC